MLPLSLTDTDGFHEMFRRANPTYQVPSSYKIKINPQEVYKVGCIRLKDKISKCDCVSLTTDGWTSRSQISFITTTLHTFIMVIYIVMYYRPEHATLVYIFKYI